jgi:hypothetical protein
MKNKNQDNNKASIAKTIYSISKNVSIMMLKVMTLTIVTHYIQNFVIINLPTTKMVKIWKEYLRVAIVHNLRAKP